MRHVVFFAIVSGISLFSTHELSITIAPFSLFTLAPRYSNISSNASISEISGMLSITTISSDKRDAGTNATALFFAPLIWIVPLNLCPPSIFICFIKTSITILICNYLTGVLYSIIASE